MGSQELWATIKLHVDRKKLTTYSVQIKKDFTLPKYDQDSLDKRY